MRFQHNPFTDKLDISGMGPGATSVDFVTGNSGGAVAADASYNINILGDNTSGINTIGNLSPSTLTIFGLASSTTQIGTTRYATNVEAAAQSSTTTALTPSNITSLFSTNPLPASQGGTGLSSPAAHSLLVTNGSSAFTVLGTASNGQIPIGSVGSDPVLATITAGTGISITNGPGSITIASDGSADVLTLTGNTGGAISPTAGNINTVGTGSITIAGSGSTLTTQLTGLTNHNVLVGAGTATITNVAPSATSGVPLISQGAAADPVFGTALVAGGGTGSTSFNANGVVVSNTTTTGALAALTLTNGQMVIGSTGTTPAAGTITSTDGSLTVTTGAGTLNLAVAGGTTVGKTITGDTGGALSPTAGNWNLLGSGSITTSGSGSTLTTQLTGLTNHAVLVGAGTSTITKIAATANTGAVLQNNSGADPSYSTATYPSTTTINQLLYSSANNTITGLATANNGVVTTGTTGTPVVTALASNGQVIIGSGSGAPAAATLTAGTNITITNGANSITIAASSGGLAWSDQSGSFTAAVSNGYFITAASTPTLPASPSEGDTISFIVDTTSTCTITGNTGQKIRLGSTLSASAGTCANNARGDAIELIYRSTGATWFALSSVGTWTIT